MATLTITNGNNTLAILQNGTITFEGGETSSTNLTYTASPTQGTVVSSTGTDAIIPAADSTNAGLLLPTEKDKLTAIEVGAEVNNISDVNATDLTDGGDTTLHIHDSRYYTETETNTLLNNKIDLNGNNSAITYENFTPSTAPTYQEGRVWYDQDSDSLSYYDDHSGTSIQIGKELIVDCRNNSGSTILNGQVVYISGALGQHPTIALAQANSLITSEIIGLATHNIANNTTGKITVIGLVNDIDTSAFTDGQQVYLSSSTTGSLTATPPASPNFVVFVGYVAHAHATQGKLLVMSDRAMANNNSLGTSQTVFPTQNSVKTYVDNGLSSKENTVTAGTISQYYRGDKTFQTLDKSAVGLNNVDNTSDVNKPISTATQTALNSKEDLSNKQTDLTASATKYPTVNAVNAGLSTKQDLDSDLTAIAGLSPSNDDIIQRKTGAWTNRTPAQFKTDLALTKSDVGLGNIDNTSDANKPISTATQTALNAKISSDPTGVSGADQITNAISLTTAEYTAIGSPNASTLYVITDAT